MPGFNWLSAAGGLGSGLEEGMTSGAKLQAQLQANQQAKQMNPLELAAARQKLSQGSGGDSLASDIAAVLSPGGTPPNQTPGAAPQGMTSLGGAPQTPVQSGGVMPPVPAYGQITPEQMAAIGPILQALAAQRGGQALPPPQQQFP